MNQHLAPWLRKGALAVAALALFAGVAPRAQATALVGVYEKSGFDYLVNLGDSSTLGTVAFDANVAEFGGSTSGAKFAVISVVNRNMVDSLALPVANVIFSTLTTPISITDTAISQAQGLVAGFGTADSWFDLIPAIVSGAAGTHTTVAVGAGNSFATKVNDTFFGAFPFSTFGTVAADGTLSIPVYAAIAGSDFNDPPTQQSITQLMTVKVFTDRITKVPEPASLVLLGIAMAACATLRRRSA